MDLFQFSTFKGESPELEDVEIPTNTLSEAMLRIEQDWKVMHNWPLTPDYSYSQVNIHQSSKFVVLII